jgi:carbonic anhydrase
LRSGRSFGPGWATLAGMGTIDEVLAANEVYARTHELRRLTPRPARKLAVLMCMDTRLSIRMMGLVEGDAHIIRNAGGIVTDDALRSLIVSHYLLGTEEFMVINHTDCGLMQTSEQDLRTRIQNRTGTAAVAPAFFYAFQNIEENVRHQLQKLRTHPWIPEKVVVRGFVYDVGTGKLREVKDFSDGRPSAVAIKIGEAKIGEGE